MVDAMRSDLWFALREKFRQNGIREQGTPLPGSEPLPAGPPIPPPAGEDN